MVKKIIIGVVFVAMLAVIGTLLMYLFFNPEIAIKRTVEEITQDYYENYFYDNFIKTVTKESQDEALERYSKTGFAEVSLRGLLLFNGGKYASLSDGIMKYCDTDKTNVQFFPKAPYGNKNYEIKFNYSCNF